MKRFLLAVVLLSLIIPVFSQPEGETAESLFYDADDWYTEDEEYQEAAYLYKQVLNMEPDNANVKFLMGMCYNNIKGMEAEAIPYFKEATKDITLKYKAEQIFCETSPASQLVLPCRGIQENQPAGFSPDCSGVFQQSEKL